jgi:hypothetical protein
MEPSSQNKETNQGEKEMPDLTLETRYHCKSCKYWERNVGKHIVIFDEHSHQNQYNYQYDYSCSCEAYKFGKGKQCKHIIEARHWHCQWEGRTPSCMPNGELGCPSCFSEVFALQHGVWKSWAFTQTSYRQQLGSVIWTRDPGHEMA